jgi:hypothetical protein
MRRPTVWSMAHQSYWQSQAEISSQAEGYRCQELSNASQSGSQDEGQSCTESERAAKMDKNLNPGLHSEHWRALGK